MLHGTPRLNAIIGYSELLTEEAEEAGQAHLVPEPEKIRGAGKHLLALINNILDLSFASPCSP